MRITSKGQVTIPQAIRERLGLLPNTEVEFDVIGDAARIRPAGRKRRMSRGDIIVAHLRGRGGRRHGSTDELMKLLRSEK